MEADGTLGVVRGDGLLPDKFRRMHISVSANLASQTWSCRSSRRQGDASMHSPS